MKKKLIYVAAVLVISAVTVLNVKTVLEANRAYDLAMTSIDALSENVDKEDTDQESNNEGSGQFFYKHLEGKPQKCNLFRYVHVDGRIEYSESEKSLGAGWTSTKVTGLIETCPKRGDGCTAYSCQTTN